MFGSPLSFGILVRDQGLNPGPMGFVRFLHCKVVVEIYFIFDTVLFGRKLLCAAHCTQHIAMCRVGVMVYLMNVELLLELFSILQGGAFVFFLLFLFIYQHRLVDIYYLIFFAQNVPSFGHWRLCQLPLCPFDMSHKFKVFPPLSVLVRGRKCKDAQHLQVNENKNHSEYLFTFTRMGIIIKILKKPANNKYLQEVLRNCNSLNVAGGNVKWYGQFGCCCS